VIFWRNHEATPRQQRLAFGAQRRRGRRSQADVILQLLRERGAQGKALELPEIMAQGIAQHSARFSELKERGFKIENEMERDTDGRVLSRYYLRFDPETERHRDDG
jgi:hypothetical protein